MPMTTPEFTVAEWMNGDRPLTLSDLEGRVVVLFDRNGQRVQQFFGQISALAPGANIGALLVSNGE